MKKVVRSLYYTGFILLFVLAATTGVTQSRMFHAYLLHQLLVEADSALSAQLSIDAIEGNLFTGFTLFNVRLVDRGITVVAAERVELRYDPFGLPLKHVRISRALVVHPQIFVYRALDGTWNTEHIAVAHPKDTSASAWTIDLRRVIVQEGRLQLIDSLGLQRDRSANFSVLLSRL